MINSQAMPVSTRHRPETLETDRFTLIIRPHHSARVHQDQLQRFDVPGGEENSPLARQSAGRVGQAVVTVPVAGVVLRGAEVDLAAVWTLLTAHFQAEETGGLTPSGGVK